MNTTPTPSIPLLEHTRNEWFRMAHCAMKQGRAELAGRFHAAANYPSPAMPIPEYDSLQRTYRNWLNWGFSAC